MECGFGWTPWTNPVGSQTPGSPPFQFSHYTRVRNPDTLRFTSASFEGNNEQSLESPVMEGSLPSSRSSADQSSHKTFQVLLGGFVYSKEFLSPSFHPVGLSLSPQGVPKKTIQENLDCFVGTLISTTPAVWKAPLHYRALQCSLLISFKRLK